MTTAQIALDGVASTYKNSGSTTCALTCPSGVAPTSLMVALVTDATNGSGAGINAVPGASGGYSWTAPDTDLTPGGGVLATNMYYKLVGTDTPGTTTYSWTLAGTHRIAGVLQAFSGPWGLNPIDNNGADHGSNPGTATTTAVMPSVSSHHIRAALIGGVGWRNGTAGLTNSSLSMGSTGFTKVAEITSTSAGNNNGVASLLYQQLTGALSSSNLTMNNTSAYGAFLWGVLPTPLGPVVVPARALISSGVF